jgi:hypothetical protein
VSGGFGIAFGHIAADRENQYDEENGCLDDGAVLGFHGAVVRGL